MNEIDILCFDIQDVGARFYTYIYTMSYAMEAAAKYNKEFVVFDRPNPVGDEVEGNILNLEYRSFVGYHQIVERHGMTVGELAKLFNEEFQINTKLHVVKMKGYDKKTDFSEYNLKWVSPSPNIPNVESVYYYLATCYFEGTNVSEGRGTAIPFKVFGAPWLKADRLICKLKELNLAGIEYKKTYFTPYTSKHAGTMCVGVELFITDFKTFKPIVTGLSILSILNDIQKELIYREPWRPGGKQMIDYLVGDDFIRQNSLKIEEINKKIKFDSAEFIKTKEKYQLYEN